MIGDLFCQTDNTTLAVWVGSTTLSDADENAIRATLDQSYTTTDLNVQYHSSPVTTGTAETDIMYGKGSGVPSGNIGWTWCDDSVSSTTCDQHYVRWTTATAVNQPTACHETGHSVGLTHGANASPAISNTSASLNCMQRPSSGGGSFLGSHNAAQINATY